jgi:hypothetical protein
MFGAAKQRVAQASHPQTKEKLETVWKGVKSCSLCLLLMLGTPK